MSTQAHLLTIENSDIIKQVEARTFKIGKAHDKMIYGSGQSRTSYTDKVVSDIKLTDLGYDRSMVYGWIDEAVGHIASWFSKYLEDRISSGSKEQKRSLVTFHMPSSWPSSNGEGFNSSCREYVINYVIYKFLRLSIPKEAEVYREDMKSALSEAEMSMFAKTGGETCQ